MSHPGSPALPSSFPAPASAGRRSAAAAALSALSRANRRRRDGQLLLSLPDYLLKDIGISRGEIEDAVTRGARRDFDHGFMRRF